jgi:hypothetical protein
MKLSAICILMFTLFMNSYSMEKKTIVHLALLPLIEGAGIYSSVKAIGDGNAQCRAAGITNISLLAINAGLGSFTMFGKTSNYTSFRTIHRIIGFVAAGTGLWLTFATANDRDVASHVKYTSGGYTLATAIPLLIFKF